MLAPWPEGVPNQLVFASWIDVDEYLKIAGPGFTATNYPTGGVTIHRVNQCPVTRKEVSMKFIVNIGLDVEATSGIAAQVAREIIVANNLFVEKTRVVQSDTEPTLVAEVVYPGHSAMLCIQCLTAIANDLKQDCIAVYRPETGMGALVGPRAAKWGKFNPELFFMLNGKRLSSTHAAKDQPCNTSPATSTT